MLLNESNRVDSNKMPKHIMVNGKESWTSSHHAIWYNGRDSWFVGDLYEIGGYSGLLIGFSLMDRLFISSNSNKAFWSGLIFSSFNLLRM